MFLLSGCFDSEKKAQLTVQTFTGSATAAMANAHLIMGDKEAILVDVVMSKTEALKLADMVKNSKRTLKVIFITHAHPDHFLGLDVLADAFPDAEILSSTAVAEAIKKNGPTLIGRMRTILSEDGPARLIVPELLSKNELFLEDVPLNVIEFSEGESEYHTALFIASSGDYFASDLIYNQTHLFLREKRIDGWSKQLDRIENMAGVKTIFPGHGPKTDLSSIKVMRAYLQDFSKAVSLNSVEEAKAMMLEKYPEYNMRGFLDYSLPSFFVSTLKR